MDGLTLRAAATLARERYAGLRVTGVRWAVPAGLLLGFGPRFPALLLAVDPALHGLLAVPRGEESRTPMPPALEALTRAVAGATLTGVTTEGLERVVRLGLEKVSPAGRARRWTLILEAMGRWSNLVLAEEPGGTVAAALKTIAPRAGGRGVLPGKPYGPPPPASRPDPSALGSDELERLLAGAGGPKELASRVAGVSAASFADLQRAAERLGRSVASLLAEAVAQPPREGWLEGARGRWRVAPCFAGTPPPSGVPAVDLLELTGELHRRAAASRDLEGPRDAALREADRGLKGLADLKARLAAELAESDRAGELRSWGTLLTAHLAELERGSDRFVTDRPFGQPGERVTVPLDPKLSPQANAARLFSRARKLDNRAGLLAGRLADLDSRLGELARVRDSLAAAASPEEVAPLAARARRLAGRRETKADAPPAPPAPRPRAPRRYLEYRSSGGFRIIVGRDASSNDYVLSRLASPDDVWCHADGFPGSHVVIKPPARGAQPPEEVVREACALAAWHSQARGEGSVPVSYTLRKHVRKPRGAAPGLVVLARRRTMLVRPALPPGQAGERGGAA